MSKPLTLALVITALSPAFLCAQVGNDNPTGVAGQFNGNITTACSYDPYTANATRSITDLVVAGGVGTYPLAFTRTMTSRYTAGLPCEMGPAGSWKHSFQWSIDTATVVKTGSVGRPASYNVNYPDGRRVIFSASGGNDPKFRGPAGVRDRFDQLAAGATECYLWLPDGGKIWFHADITTTPPSGGANTVFTSVYRFSLKGIIDPYGQTTTITYPADGSMTITEHAGRTLKLFYRQITSTTEGQVGDTVLNYVLGSDGRRVDYTYSAYVTSTTVPYTSLTRVRYFNDSSLDALYQYQDGNTDANDRPLIKTCVDPMYDGPMWKIAYSFVPNATGVVYGQIQSEKYFDGANIGAAVSTLAVTGTTTRRETRGDNPAGTGNPTRTFTYNGYKLKITSDFKGANETNGYDGTSYLDSVTDRNGNVTTSTRNGLNGNVQLVTYPTPGDVIPSNTATKVRYQYGDTDAADPKNRDGNRPYYLASIEDGNGKPSQTFYRDATATMQVSSISYPFYDSDTGALVYNLGEAFTYNNFGQVLTHQFKNTATESYTYDGMGRITAYYDAAHPTTANPTARYQYDSFGRIAGITDARGVSSGDPNYTTTLQCNARGQLTRLTHPGGSYVQYVYNPNGTLAWTADERHPGAASDATQRTSYTYDDYKRLRTVTTPLRGQGDNTPRTTTYFYDAAGTGEDYARVGATPTKMVSPGGKVTKFVYDENLRTTRVIAMGDTNVPDAMTVYTYDACGNQKTVTDPNGNLTTYFYDKMNRVFALDDPIPSHRAPSTGHTVRYNFDPGGNKIQHIRADDKIYKWKYDSFGRVTRTTGFLGEIIDYQYARTGDQAGNMTAMIDPAQKTYSYHYDPLGRQDSMTYPADASGTSRTEQYHYDNANHLDRYTSPAGQIKTLSYDGRGRLTGSSWNVNGPSVTVSYDATRPTGIVTAPYTVAGVNCPGTTVAFGSDEANNRVYEDQTISGLPTRRVQTDPDADGSRKNLLVKTGATVNFANSYDYTSRNELLNIRDSNNNPFFKYSYDANGNVTQRLNLTAFPGSSNPEKTVLQYDAVNQPTLCAQYGPASSSAFATSHYDYSKIGNLRDTWRDEEGGKGDYFEYDDMNQLTLAMYSATNPTGASPSNPARKVNYNLGPRNRISMTVNDAVAGTTTTTNYGHDDLNQYTTINGAGLQYDPNFNLANYNGWNYVYDAENRLISVSGNNHSAQFFYDGVGRCVKRTIDGATTLFSYDQWTPIMEWDSNGNLIATNVYGLGDDEILYRSAGSTQTFYKTDPMGNVRFLLSSSGAGVEKYAYDAFGQPTITDWNGNLRTTSALANRFMFSGREFFSSLGLYDLRNRVYDPIMGRFYQNDPISFDGDASNLYRFSGNNPSLGGDPSGLGFFQDFWFSFTHPVFQFGSGDDHSSGGSSGDIFYNPLGLDNGSAVDAGFGGVFPWAIYASSNTTAGPTLSSPNVPTVSLKPQGTFSITATVLESGSTVRIEYSWPQAPAGATFELRQTFSGLVPGNRFRSTSDFVRDKKLERETPTAHGFIAYDEPGLWQPKANPNGGVPPKGNDPIPYDKWPRGPGGTTMGYSQQFETVAVCKYNGQEQVVAACAWGHKFTGQSRHSGVFTGAGKNINPYLPPKAPLRLYGGR